MGFQCVLSSIFFFTTCFPPFSPLSSMGFCIISSGFLHFYALSMYVSKNVTRLLHFPMVVCTISSGCYHIFRHFHCIFQHFPMDFARFPLIVIMPSPSFSDGCLHHFLWLLSHSPAFSLYYVSIFTASSRFVPSIRSGFLHFSSGFCTISSDRYHVFLQFHCVFQYILFVGFQRVLSNIL